MPRAGFVGAGGQTHLPGWAREATLDYHGGRDRHNWIDIDMRLHCLGTAGYHPSETRQTSCYFLPESGVVLDAGSGIYRLPSLIQTDSLDILLSHAHLDHIVGLTFLLGILHRRPVKSVRVWGQREKLDAIRRLVCSEFIFPVELPVAWVAIDDRPTFSIQPLATAVDGRERDPANLLPPITVHWRTQTHPGTSVAYRLEWGDPEESPEGLGSPLPMKSLVYATDTVGATAVDEGMLDWMSRPDLLMHECNFADKDRHWAEKTGHCWLGRVAEISRATAPKQVLLTHINPVEELNRHEAESAMTMPVQIAADTATIEF